MNTDANAPGGHPRLSRIRGLDGIRALSVLAIIAFHTGLNSVPGGFYGVDSFFVLSGFLITSLLGQGVGRQRNDPPPTLLGRSRPAPPARAVPARRRHRHRPDRRAQRPGHPAHPRRRALGDLLRLELVLHSRGRELLLADLPAVAAAPHLVPGDRGAVLPGLAAGGAGRAQARYGGPPPPAPAARGTLGPPTRPTTRPTTLHPRARRRPVGPRRAGRLPGPTRHGSAAGGSTFSSPSRVSVRWPPRCSWCCEAPNGYTSRAYYGTDTRAQALLVGAALAIGLTLWRERTSRPWFTRAASVLALAGVAGTALLWATTSQTSTFAFSGGFMLASLAAGGVVLGCAMAPRSVVVRLLELPPLPQLGRISYGIYLWYWPVVLVMSGQRLDWSPYPLFVARVAVTAAIAAVSYELVEMPIRRGALRRWRSWVAAPVGAAIAISMVLVSMLVPVGAAELQGKQLAVTAPSSVKTSPAAGDARRLPQLGALDPWLTDDRPARTGHGPGHRPRPRPRFPRSCHPRCRRRPPPSPSRCCWSATPSPARSAWVWPRRRSPTTCRSSTRGPPPAPSRWRAQIRVLWYTVSPDPPCDVGGNPNSLFDTWRAWVNAYNPDVVIYLARGETFDQGGRGPVAEHRAARFRQLPGQPVPPGGLRPRLQGRQRRPVDDPVLRQRDLTRRHALARGRAEHA